MRVTVPGDDVRTEADLHRILAQQLEFGDHYGRNLAALRDRLEKDVPRPVDLVWTRSAVSREQLGGELFDRIATILRNVAAQDAEFGWADRFTVRFE